MMKKLTPLILALLLAIPMCANAAAVPSWDEPEVSTFTIDFTFARRVDDVAQINALLSSMKLASIDLSETDLYLETSYDGRENVTGRRLGLNGGTIAFELADDEPGHIYQLMTEVVDLDVDHEEYIQNWRDSHPDLILNMLIRVEYDEAFGYLAVYYAKD